MVNRHSILVVIDPTAEDQPALLKAAEFAHRIGADLALLLCIFDSDIAHVQWVTGHDLEHIRDAAIDGQFERLQQLADSLRSDGHTVSFKIAWDAPLHEAVVREAQRIGADFVVKDTHHHSPISRALFTNTDWHLIRECPAALWLVKTTPAPDHATVMVAMDPTHEHDQPAALDHRIIQTAQLFSAMFEERLHIAHAFNLPVPHVSGAFGGPAVAAAALEADVIRKTREAHQAALETLAADVGFPADQIHMGEGSPADVLPRMADELKANIVVMGAVARSPLQRVVIGSTAERTLDRFHCDVVVVKPEDFTSPIESIPQRYGYIERISD